MSTGDVCVAAIDLQKLCIMRPLRWNHHNWPRDLAIAGLKPGRIVCQEIRAQQDAHGYPHQTEDLQLRNDLELTPTALEESDLFAALSPCVDRNIDTIFSNQVIDRKYVIDGTKTRSLGSVLVKASDTEFTRNDFGRWRLLFNDGLASHDLPITDLRAHNAIESGRASKIETALRSASKNKQRLLLRVGLARGWAGKNDEYDPKRCYLQVNGLIFTQSPGF